MDSSAIEILSSLGELKKNEPLSEYTSFKTGGPAEYLITLSDAEKISEAVKTVNLYNIPLTIIGGGSNLLVSDNGVEGLVLRIASNNSEDSIKKTSDGVYCPASVSKTGFLNFCIEHGYGGIEFMAGIPGVIGGGVFMNAGTYMGSFADIVETVETVDRSGEIERVKLSLQDVSYRDIGLGSDCIIAGVYLKLEPASDPASVKQAVDEIIRDRNSKHPVSRPSAGSVFKNPVGYSSWKLVRDCGFAGKKIGGAEVSSLHTNFIINSGGASSIDIKRLIEEIQAAVIKKYDLMLETEIKIIGRF